MQEKRRIKQLSEPTKDNTEKMYSVGWISPKTGKPTGSGPRSEKEAERIYDEQESKGLVPTIYIRYIGGYAF